MPKSRQPYNYKYKPTYHPSEKGQPGSHVYSSSIIGSSSASSASSTLLSSSAAASGTSELNSVQELLAHLRATQPASIPDTREAQSPSHGSVGNYQAPVPTVHPSLQHVLGIVGTPPPRPRVRGLAVPNSWRIRNGVDPFGPINDTSSNISSTTGFESNLPSLELGSSSDAENISGLPRYTSDSLVDQCLKSIARNWAFHITYDKYYLRELRPIYKSLVLAHLATYTVLQRQQCVNEEDIVASSITRKSFELLFKESIPETIPEGKNIDDIEYDLGLAGTEHIAHLNLAGAIGYSISLQDLRRIFGKASQPSANLTSQTPSIAITSASAVSVLESWEDFVDDETRPAVLIGGLDLGPKYFVNLTHLSLAYPSNTVSFADLIRLAKDSIPTITHLSLAGWATPSSGHHTLSSAERVAFNLKQLSRNLLCLKYLDVSECSADMYEGLREVDWAECWRKVTEVIARQGQALSARGSRILEQRNVMIIALAEEVKAIRRSSKGEICRFVYSTNAE